MGLRGFQEISPAKAIAILVAALAMLIAIWPGQAHAQEGGAPPWPILYSGEVYFNDVLLQGNAQLTVRVGDWESKPVPVVDGRFRCADPCLIAGPPSQTYIGQRVTFHLSGEHEASHSFDFPTLPQPASETIHLYFEESNTALLWGGFAATAVVGMVAAGGWYTRGRRRG